MPLVVQIEGDEPFELDAISFDANMTSSEIRIVSGTRALLQAPASGSGLLLSVGEGAPVVSLRGLILRGQIAINGSHIDVSNCTFEASAATDGGALTMSAGGLAVRESTFTNNRAARNGGAVHIVGGDASFDACRFTGNLAGELGGALHVGGSGRVTLSEATLFTGNAASSGNSMYIHGSSALSYRLPAPLGRWIYSMASSSSALTGAIDSEYPFACAHSLDLVRIGLNLIDLARPVAPSECQHVRWQVPRASLAMALACRTRMVHIALGCALQAATARVRRAIRFPVCPGRTALPAAPSVRPALPARLPMQLGSRVLRTVCRCAPGSGHLLGPHCPSAAPQAASTAPAQPVTLCTAAPNRLLFPSAARSPPRRCEQSQRA